MKLTLRKASALQKLLQKQIAGIQLPVQASISIYEDPAKTLEAAATLFQKNLSQVEKLTIALYELRSKAARANVEVGVSDLLTAMAHTDKQSELVTKFAGVAIRPTPEVLQARYKAAQTPRSATGYGGLVETFAVGILTEAQVAEFANHANEYRKEKQRLSDKLLHLNVSTEIEVSATTESTLKEFGII